MTTNVKCGYCGKMIELADVLAEALVAANSDLVCDECIVDMGGPTSAELEEIIAADDADELADAAENALEG